MELNLLNINHQGNSESPPVLLLTGVGVGGPRESDDGNIDTRTIRQVAPRHSIHSLTLSRPHTLSHRSSDQHQQNYNTTLQIQS